MEENKNNLTDLEAERARKLEILNEMNNLKFNTASSEEITDDMFNNISENKEEKPVVEETIDNKQNDLEIKKENIEVESNQEIVEPIQEQPKEIEKEPKSKINDSKIEQQKSMNESLKVSYFDVKL